MTTDNSEQGTTGEDTSKRIVRTICPCGCEKLTVPHHLRDADLWISFTIGPPKKCYIPKYVSFSLKYDVTPDNKGWK